MRRLGRTGIDVYPVCLGANVFGWTADEHESHAVLDAYAKAGGNFVDTANSYLVEHGLSEKIIGRWFAARGGREQGFIVATKVGGGGDPALRNLRAETIHSEARASLRRLHIDHIDLYYAHFDDPQTPLEESLRAFDELVREGLVRHLGASNYAPQRLAEAMELQRSLGLTPFTVLQPHYNLIERDYERELAPLARSWDLAVLPYYSLASGFLTGKYRPDETAGDSPRASHAAAYLERGGTRVLEALDQVAQAHGVPQAAVALAWLLSRPTVTAPIASARNTRQLDALLAAATLELSPAEISLLDASAPPASPTAQARQA